MFCGIELSKDFYQDIESLDLDMFHMRNFRYQTGSHPGWIFRLLLFP